MNSILNKIVSQIVVAHESDPDPVQNIATDQYGVQYGKYNGVLALVKCINEGLTEYTVISGTAVIYKSAFWGMSYLKRIILPDTVEIIEQDAFLGCSYLKNIKMSANLKTIGEDAFSDCRSLKRIVLPETLTTIIGNPFKMCNINIINKSPDFKVDGKLLIHGTKVICQLKQPTSIKVPLYIKEIGESACKNNFRLKKLVLPEGLTVIGKQAFLECHALRDINMPDTVTTIDDEAFAGCNFWRFTFPKSLTHIGYDALWGFALLSVVIPSNLHIVNADTLPEETIHNIDDIIISCSPDKSKNNGIRRRFRNLLGDYLYSKVKLINSIR
ncbi:MAG: leucine-rich repeat domain-containing protein [Prevotella sp.]|nr:leucine-rich repeat domain-containing protein [Prevotella sp.]